MSFDPNTFLSTTFTEANDTTMVPVPAGEYLAISEKVDIKPWASKDGSSSGIKLEIVWEIQDENVKALTGRDTVRVTQQQMLDLTDTGQLDLGKGKNVGLGRLREALDLNTPGQPFAFPMMQGRMAKVVVSHRTYNDEIFAEIKRVAKAG